MSRFIFPARQSDVFDLAKHPLSDPEGDAVDTSIYSLGTDLSSIDLTLGSNPQSKVEEEHNSPDTSLSNEEDSKNALAAPIKEEGTSINVPHIDTPPKVKVINNVASFWCDPPVQLTRRERVEKMEKLERELKATLLSLRQFKFENEQMRRKLKSLGHDANNSYTIYNVSSSSIEAPPLFSCFSPESLGIELLLDSPETKPPYAPPLETIHWILGGTMTSSDLEPKHYRAVVWVVANCVPNSTIEGNSIKSAVNHLTHELAFHSGDPAINLLTTYIIEYGIKLCKTASGNYLCQVMLHNASADDRRDFILAIRADIIDIANHRFGCHVLNKALESDDLQGLILQQLETVGIPASMQTGARRYTEICRKSKDPAAFELINEGMKDHWVSTAIANEHGSIACQQVFEVYPTSSLMEPCYREIIASIHIVANSVFGRFVVSKLLALPAFADRVVTAILTASSPVAVTSYGISFVKSSFADRGREGVSTYITALCKHEEGESAGLIEVASSSLGPNHLKAVLSLASDSEKALIYTTCREFSTTLRMSQSGNDFLRLLGLVGNGTAMGPRKLRR